MGCIIVSTPKQEDANRLRDVIRRSGICEDVVISTRGAEILELVANQDVYLVICTRRFTDMGYQELSSLLPVNINMLLIAGSDVQIPFSSNIMKLATPFKPGDLINSVRMLLPYEAGHSRRKKKPERSSEERKLVDDAKLLLMNRNDMTEPEAFRYIQKVSMDTGRSMVETAQMILLMNSG